MIISLNWLKKYIELGESTAELEKLLTFAGIEVEAVKELPALPKSVISAKVVSAVAVPKTDHLQQCLVNIGEYDYPEKNEAGYVQVICGAPNCHAGMMAIIALPGSELPGYTIGKAKIRVWNRTECSARKRNWAFPTIMPESSSFPTKLQSDQRK
jgi:phenylalanyl-tRNA synthetase beta chain